MVRYRHFKTIVYTIVAICILVPLVIMFTGCSTAKVDTISVRKDVLDYVYSDASKTGTLMATAQSQGQQKYNALEQYRKSIVLSDVTYTFDKASKNVTLNCTAEIPTVESLQKELLSSDSFMSEYKAADDSLKDQCVYNYIVNMLISGSGVESDSVKLTSSSVSVDTAVSTLSAKADELYQQALSEFVLTKFYSEEAISDIKAQSVPFVEATDLRDFVVKYNKHKIAVTNITVLQGSEAKSKLCSLSSNNNLVITDNSQQLYYVEYRMTNLTKGEKGVKLDNFFSLGDSSSHLYSNTGFHFEGLSIPTTVKYGESCVFSAALVGDTAANLYFYDEAMYGARHWAGVPVTVN